MADLVAPDRLFVTECEVCRHSDAEMGIDGDTAWVPFAVDLADVVVVRAVHDWDEGPLDDQALLELTTGATVCVRAPFDAVLALWAAWRRHADRMDRLRN